MTYRIDETDEWYEVVEISPAGEGVIAQFIDCDHAAFYIAFLETIA